MNEILLRWQKYYEGSYPAPTREEMIGKWKIKMDGWRKILFKNIKVIKCTGHSSGVLYHGYNIAFWIWSWGKLYVAYWTIPSVCIKGKLPKCQLIYRNGKIIDEIVSIAHNKKKGLYIKNGIARDTFTMTRIT